MESSQGQGLVFYSVLNIPPPQGGMCTRRHLAHSPDCLPQQGCHPWGANLGPNASWGLFGVGIEEDKRTVVSSSPGCYGGPQGNGAQPLLPSSPHCLLEAGWDWGGRDGRNASKIASLFVHGILYPTSKRMFCKM